MTFQREIILFPFLPRLVLLFAFHTMITVSGRLLAESPWPTLYSTSFSHQPPKGDLEGRAIPSFQRPQRAESAAAEQGKQSSTFPAAWSPPFQRDVTHSAITEQTSQKVTTHCTYNQCKRHQSPQYYQWAILGICALVYGSMDRN